MSKNTVEGRERSASILDLVEDTLNPKLESDHSDDSSKDKKRERTASIGDEAFKVAMHTMNEITKAEGKTGNLEELKTKTDQIWEKAKVAVEEKIMSGVATRAIHKYTYFFGVLSFFLLFYLMGKRPDDWFYTM